MRSNFFLFFNKLDPSVKRIAQKRMKNYPENIHYLDKFTVRKVQERFSEIG